MKHTPLERPAHRGNPDGRKTHAAIEIPNPGAQMKHAPLERPEFTSGRDAHRSTARSAARTGANPN